MVNEKSNAPPAYTPPLPARPVSPEGVQRQLPQNPPYQYNTTPTPPVQTVPTGTLALELGVRAVKATADIGMKVASAAGSAISGISQKVGTTSPHLVPTTEYVPYQQPPVGQYHQGPPVAQYHQQQPVGQYHQQPPVIQQTYYQQPLTQNRYEPRSYWDPLFDGKCWAVLLYFLVLDLPWTLFCLIWVLVTSVFSTALLIIFPVGYPLLFLSALSWRALAKVECLLLNVKNEVLHVWIPPVGRYQNDRNPFKRHITDQVTGNAVLYFIFGKLFTSIGAFVISVLTLVFLIPMCCLCPPLMLYLSDLLEHKRHVARKWLAHTHH